MKDKKRISIKEPGVLILGIILAILSAAICMQIMGQFGTAPNTSLIGAVLVMIVARIPLIAVKRFRNLERQNYVLSMASAAGFAAANCGFVAIATMYIIGRSDLIMPMALGTLIGSMISVFITGRIFDSKIFPAKGAWPMGTAVASTIEAGDEGGKKGFELLQGLVVGAVASFLGLPAAGVGIAFIANMFTMAALGVGMVLRGHSAFLFNGFDIGQSNIAQGIMIGAGVVALIQIVMAIRKGSKQKVDEAEYTVSDTQTIRTLVDAVGLFMIGAVAIALVTGAFGEMNWMQFIGWVVFSGFSAAVLMILVGTSSMQSGWAPTFAVVAIFLTIGVLIGFPTLPLVVMVGYLGSVGPCFADTGVGLKTGWIIRGKGMDKNHELYGRKQQVIIKQIGVVIGIAIAVITSMMLVNNDVIPPMSIFYADTATVAADPALIRQLVIWAVPGAMLQAAFGSKSVGLMLAAGLFINHPIYGIVILASIGLRLIIGTKHMNVRGPGLIAGDGLFGFGANIFNAFF